MRVVCMQEAAKHECEKLKEGATSGYAVKKDQRMWTDKHRGEMRKVAIDGRRVQSPQSDPRLFGEWEQGAKTLKNGWSGLKSTKAGACASRRILKPCCHR